MTCSYGGGPEFRSRNGQQQQQQQRRDGGQSARERRTSLAVEVAKEFAVPALGLLAAATLVGPRLGAIVISALGVGIAFTAAAAAFSVSWLLIPGLVAVFGIPLLVGGGLAAGLFAGAVLIPAALQLAIIAGGLWLGTSMFRRYVAVGSQDFDAGSSGSGDGSTIDVEAMTLESIELEMEAEARQREQELREFDDLLRRRERFQRGGP